MKSKTVIFIENRIIDDDITFNILNSFKNKKLGLDMSNVESINSKLFIKSLLSDKFKLFNLQNETLTYLSLILKEGALKSYINKSDFMEEKRELIRRKFFIAQSSWYNIKYIICF